MVDRVFILLAALSQRSLMGVSAANIIESILTMLTRLLSPLSADSHVHHSHASRGTPLSIACCHWFIDLYLVQHRKENSKQFQIKV